MMLQIQYYYKGCSTMISNELLDNVWIIIWIIQLCVFHAFILTLVQLHSWQPGIQNPYRGTVVWQVPESVDIPITLFKVPHSYAGSFTSPAARALSCLKVSPFGLWPSGSHRGRVWRQGLDGDRWRCEFTTRLLVEKRYVQLWICLADLWL